MITSRSDLIEGMLVIIKINEEEYQGFIKKIITKNNSNKGIKVELTNGKIGKVVEIVKKDELSREQKIFVNKFLSQNIKYSIWDNIDRTFVLFKIYNKNTVFLFSNKQLADDFLKKIKSTLKHSNSTINQLNKRRTIIQNIEHLKPEYIILDNKIRVKYKDFNEKEKSFNNLLK